MTGDRAARVLLIVAWATLVGIVAWQSYWLSDQLDQAHDERCAVLAAQLSVTALQLKAAGLDQVDIPEDDPAVVALRSAAEAACPADG